MNWTALWIVSEWVIRLTMLAVVPHRRRPGSAMVWLIAIFFLPVPGLILYLLLGRARLQRRRVRRHTRRIAEIRRLAEGLRALPNTVDTGEKTAMAAVAPLAERLGRLPALGGNAVELIEETETVIDRLIADIDDATGHVHLLFFIWGNDDTGSRVADALARAAGRGVVCRVLLDSVGSWYALRSAMASRMREAGVDLREALPVGMVRRRVSRIDLRNHRKIAVIDGQVAWTGSQNVINPDYGTKNLVYSDLMARLTGPAAHEVQWTFVGDWYVESGEVLDGEAVFPPPRSTGNVLVQALPSGPSDPVENYPRLLAAAIQSAWRRVVITTPYFVPDDATLAAMESAAMRGVRVDLVVPRRTDHILVDTASRAYYESLFEAGVRIFSHRQGMLHTKAMSVDGEVALVGSGNFDIRSFRLNFELNLLMYDAGIARRLLEIQERYIAQSVELTLDRWRERPRWHAVGQDVAKLLSPLL